jgi:hypothetical protein
MSEPIEISMEQELANAFLSGVDEPAVSVEPTPAAAVEAQPAEAAPKPTEDPAPPDSSWKPREFAFKRNGEEVKFTPTSAEEELELLRKGFDYTAKTMSLAEEKKQIQSLAKELAEREEARQASMKAFFSNRANVARYLELLDQSNGGPPAPAGADEEFEPVTKADLAKMRAEVMAQARAEAKAEADKNVKGLLDQAAVERLTVDYKSDLDKTISTLLARHPELEFVDGADELIRMAGNRMFKAQLALNPDQPVDPALVKAAMAEDAAKRATRTAAKLRAREKTDAVEKSTLTTRGVEPPGGNAPSTAPAPSSNKPLSLKDPALDAQVLAEIQALMK